MQIIDQKYNAYALNFPFESIISVGAGHLNAFKQKKIVRSHFLFVFIFVKSMSGAK